MPITWLHHHHCGWVFFFYPLLSNRTNSSYPQTDRPRGAVFSILFSPAFIDNTGYKLSLGLFFTSQKTFLTYPQLFCINHRGLNFRPPELNFHDLYSFFTFQSPSYSTQIILTHAHTTNMWVLPDQTPAPSSSNANPTLPIESPLLLRTLIPPIREKQNNLTFFVVLVVKFRETLMVLLRWLFSSSN